MEERRKRSRLSSQKHRAKWTEEQKRKNYDRDNEQRKKKLNQLSENEKAVIRAQGRARYHKRTSSFLSPIGRIWLTNHLIHSFPTIFPTDKNRIRAFEHPQRQKA